MPSPRTTLTTLVTLMLTFVAAQASAQGETCESAMTIPVPFTGNFDNSRAFADGPPGSCNSFTLTEMSNSQWFSFNAPQAGAVIVTITEVTPFDMIACLYTGRCGSTLTEQACGDQPEPVVMRIAVTQGMPVIIAVGDWGGPGGGTYQLDVRYEGQGETCDNPLQLPLPFSGTFDNTLAQNDGPPGSCNSFTLQEMSSSQWYAFTPPVSGRLDITITEITPFDIVATLLTSPCDPQSEVVCGDQPQPITMQYITSAAEQLTLGVGDWGGPGGGVYTLDVDFTPFPPGDTCDEAVVIDTIPFAGMFNNELAQSDGPPGSCNSISAQEMSNSQWFTFTPSSATPLTITITEITPFDIVAALYDACPPAGTEIACGDQPEPVVINFTPTPGTAYTLAVGDWGGPGGGDYELSIDFNITCPADTNHDGVVTPADFSAWVAAFNAMAPECDQNNDGMCTPADFSAWVANYNAGC